MLDFTFRNALNINGRRRWLRTMLQYLEALKLASSSQPFRADQINERTSCGQSHRHPAGKIDHDAGRHFARYTRGSKEVGARTVVTLRRISQTWVIDSGAAEPSGVSPSLGALAFSLSHLFWNAEIWSRGSRWRNRVQMVTHHSVTISARSQCIESTTSPLKGDPDFAHWTALVARP